MYLHANDYHSRGYAPADMRALLTVPPTRSLSARLVALLDRVLTLWA